MKTSKDLLKKLVSKNAGFKYVYKINNTRFEICEFNNSKGWCLNEYNVNTEELIDSYGHEGLLLRQCKKMILMQWNKLHGCGGIK